MTASAPEQARRTGTSEQRRRTGPTIVAVGVVLTLVGLAWLWQHQAAPAPYGPDAVGARVTMRLVPEAQAQAEVDALAGPGVLTIPGGRGPLLVGQVTFAVPPQAQDSAFLSLFLLDAHHAQPLTAVFGASPDGTTGQGWDGSYARVGQQVPWLSGIADVQVEDGSSTSNGMALSWGATATGPVTLVAVPLEGMIDPESLSSYTVGLTLQDDDRTLLWAQQLTATAH